MLKQPHAGTYVRTYKCVVLFFFCFCSLLLLVFWFWYLCTYIRTYVRAYVRNRFALLLHMSRLRCSCCCCSCCVRTYVRTIRSAMRGLLLLLRTYIRTCRCSCCNSLHALRTYVHTYNSQASSYVNTLCWPRNAIAQASPSATSCRHHHNSEFIWLCASSSTSEPQHLWL